MAAAAPSTLASSVEKTNGAKLSRLLIDGGTTVLRNVFDTHHPPANLAAVLNANYVTLSNLKRKKVLHQSQWDKLFPPGGAIPDSKTFDITLLFLLLSNICGLSPPLSGWHKPPPSSDNSFEANLARVKLYRNELYGHVTSTGVITAVFNVKWQEISAVLVALGLNPAEVVRLKAAPCGEDYISAVMEWVKSDEEIKAQLREVLDTQQEARQMQEEDHRTLQDTHKAVEDVLKTQEEEHQKQQKARTIQEEDHSTLQDTHKEVKGVMQIHQDTNQQVKTILKTQQDLRQTQLEDHETLQINKSTLEDVRQTSTKTQEMLDEVHLTQTKTHETVEGVAKTQEERFKALEADLQEIKQSFGSLKEARNRGSQADEVLCSLAKSEFKGDIQYHVGRFEEGTREWVFSKVQNWLDDRNSQNRVMVISANAGMGKSVIAAVICKRMQQVGRLSGSHFCQHNNACYRSPQLMLQSLAYHLCHALPKYKEALVEQLYRNLGKDLNNMGVEELFTFLFKELLSSVADPGRNMLMVIDGLDESEYQERNELLDVIANHFCKLPCWIRFLCTTRPEKNIAEALKQLKPFQLQPNEEENVQDIKLFLKKKTQYLMKPENKGALVEKLADKSEGLMLYAYFLVSFIEENVSVLDQEDFDGSLPLAISSVYHSYFKRLENELMKEHGVKEENFLNLLCAVTASQEPLPVDFVSKVLKLNANSLIARRKLLKAMGSVSSLLPIRDGCLHVIHKSVKDWLTDASCYGEHDFIMDEEEGHRILANLCSDELDNLKQKGVHDAQFSPTVKYSLQHGVRHMLQSDDAMRPDGCILEECVQKYVIDLEILYAKVCVDTSLAAEDILWLESKEISQLLSEVSKCLLNTVMLLLRKYFNTLKNHPRVFFQIVLKNGGTDLSAEASCKLKKKYPELPYMEFVHKEMRQTAALVRFQCSSQVACFDVSPQSEYMVCECEDGTIQMWSLHTGKLMWTRPVMVKKLHFGNGAYRMPLSSSGALSFYRSVVFHPSASIVIPGVLSHAYTFDGDQKPLLPESNCSFTVCSVSGDKAKMLTDCPDDAKCIIMWSLKNGSEITRTTRNADVLSFAWSPHGKRLAISHSTGSICIVDAEDGFSTLAEIDIQERCGTIKFTPDCWSLWCFDGAHLLNHLYCFEIIMADDRNLALDLRSDESYVPWEFESRSEAGFLLGDPLSSVNVEFNFVLSNETVLRGSPGDTFIDILSIKELKKSYKKLFPIIFTEIAFSLNGETIYFNDVDEPIFRAWNVASGELVGCLFLSSDSRVANHLVTVKQGVLLRTGSAPVELWSFDLSKCVRNFTCVYGIRKMIPISEERVACEVEDKVIILDTASGEIVSTIPIGRRRFVVACNSKHQLLTDDRDGPVELSDGKTTLWKASLRISYMENLFGTFSLAERFVVICIERRKMKPSTIYVLDAVSGETLHSLYTGTKNLYDCKFISDEECVISSSHTAGDHYLQLFNVKSGDLLSVINLERIVNCLAVCPRKRLLVITQRDSKYRFKLIQVHLPQDKDSRKRTRTLITGDHKKIQVGEKEMCFCLVKNDNKRTGFWSFFDDDDDDDM